MMRYIEILALGTLLFSCGTQPAGSELRADTSMVVDGSWDPFVVSPRRENRFVRAMKGVDVAEWNRADFPAGNVYEDQWWKGSLMRSANAAPGVPSNVNWEGFQQFDEHYLGPVVVAGSGRGLVDIYANIRLLHHATLELLTDTLFKIEVKLVARVLTASDQQLADNLYHFKRTRTFMTLYCKGTLEEEKLVWENAIDQHARGAPFATVLHEKSEYGGRWHTIAPIVSVSHADLSRCKSDLYVQLHFEGGGFHFGQIEVTTLQMQ